MLLHLQKKGMSASLPFPYVTVKYPLGGPVFCNSVYPGSPRQGYASMKYGLSPRALIRDNASRILFLRRSTKCTYWPGEWELTGGKPDAGEDIFRCLCREA